MRRVVLKLSGEALASAASDETIDASTVDFLASEIANAMERGNLELAVVVGGGNIWRGATGAMAGMNRANSDLMGMLGTVINALALQDAIETHGRPTRVLSAIGMDQVAEPYIRRRAVRHLEKGRVVIFAAGTVSYTHLDVYKRQVQELLGHESLTTTQIYTHVSKSRLQKVHHDTHPRG